MKEVGKQNKKVLSFKLTDSLIWHELVRLFLHYTKTFF